MLKVFGELLFPIITVKAVCRQICLVADAEDWAGQGWAGLGWTGLDWAGLQAGLITVTVVVVGTGHQPRPGSQTVTAALSQHSCDSELI